MISQYTLNQSHEWDTVVKSFHDYDVYYLSGYVKAFQLHGDGEARLLYYESDGLRAIYVYMKRATMLPEVFDSITPYGYGGFLIEGEVSDARLQDLWSEYRKTMKSENIIDNFVRYHPVLNNASYLRALTEVTDLGKTIALDLSSPEIIWNGITSKNRNMIRKAEKSGITISHTRDYSLFQDFRSIYNVTMQKDNAEQYYFFEEEFYNSIHNDLNDHYEMFYAAYEDKIVAMSIMLYANKQMHYHLSGSLPAYRNLAPTNLLLYKAALWGNEQGFRTFHLGGGVGAGADGLYKFKAAFNRYSDYTFSVGREIFDREKYDELVALRAKTDSVFNKDSKFFPLYRS